MLAGMAMYKPDSCCHGDIVRACRISGRPGGSGGEGGTSDHREGVPGDWGADDKEPRHAIGDFSANPEEMTAGD